MDDEKDIARTGKIELGPGLTAEIEPAESENALKAVESVAMREAHRAAERERAIQAVLASARHTLYTLGEPFHIDEETRAELPKDVLNKIRAMELEADRYRRIADKTENKEDILGYDDRWLD